jgi:hypothetical protein
MKLGRYNLMEDTNIRENTVETNIHNLGIRSLSGSGHGGKEYKFCYLKGRTLFFSKPWVLTIRLLEWIIT